MATRMIAKRAETFSNQPYWTQSGAKARPQAHSRAAIGTALALLLLVRVSAGATPKADDANKENTQLIQLGEGQSQIIDLAAPVKRVIANDPGGQIMMPQSTQRGPGEPNVAMPPGGGGAPSGGNFLVARAQLISPRQLVVTAVHVGATQFILMDEQDRATVYDIVVQINTAQLKALLADAAPGSKIDVKVLKDAVILRGLVANVDISRHVEEITKLITQNVQNHLTVAGEQQVLLRCSVAEVNKQGLRQLGVNGWLGGSNFHDVFAVNQIGGINPVNIGAFGGFGPVGGVRAPNIPFGTDKDGLNLLPASTFSLGFPRAQMQLFFQAMRQNNLAKVLAEPNLIALNGQTATFIAGGEFPIPIPQGIGGAVTVEFKEFGIRLKFQPSVIGQNMIRLKVSPEVSELDYTNAVQLQGFVIPALTKRSAETTLELASGTTIAMAGLLSEQVRASASKIPALGDVPVLGALFSSTNYQRNVSELVILVTPELVAGMNPDQVPAVPGQCITEPNDWQLFALGLLEGEPAVDGTGPDDALDTHPGPKYRKFSSSPHQMSLHGPWGPAEASESGVE